PIALGLAVGVLVDAFVVRMTLVPAVLALLDRHAWWLPGWMDRLLPKVDVEGEGLAHGIEHRDWPERNGAVALRPAGTVVPLLGERAASRPPGPLTGPVPPRPALVGPSADDA